MTDEQQMLFDQMQKDHAALLQRVAEVETELWQTMGRLQYAFDALDEAKLRLIQLEERT